MALLGLPMWATPQQPVNADAPPHPIKSIEAVDEKLRGLRERLAAIAREPGLQRALQAGDARQLDYLQQGLQQGFPEALGFQILPADWIELVPNRVPGVDFADLDMLRRADVARLAPAAEVHRVGRADEHVSLVQPVIDERGRVLGNLLLRLPWGPFQGLLRQQRGPDGQVQLVQLVEGREQVLAGSHPEGRGGPDSVWSIPGSAWQIRAWSPAPPPPWRALALGIGIPALLGMGGLAFWLVVRRYRPEPEWLPFPELTPADVTSTGSPLTEAASGTGERAPIGEPSGPDLLSRLERAADSTPDSRSVEAIEMLEGPLGGERELSPGHVPQSIFRAYDIRGVVGQTLTPAVVYEVGRAIGSEVRDLGERRMVVGRDGRLSGPALCRALINGLGTAGIEVVDIGMVPTPVLYYASAQLRIPSAVMVTGSHNPPDYNGLKILLGGETLAEKGIQRLRERIEAQDLHYLPTPETASGAPLSPDIISDYVGRVLDKVVLARPLRVVVDCGNGAAGLVAPKLLRALGCSVTELFCEVDGEFPNHHPDPSQPGNLSALIDQVRREEADLGLAFDGDGDRLGVVDDEGRIIWPDRQMMLYAADVLARHPGATILYDVKCTGSLDTVIRNRGGEPLMWKTGHSLIKAKMRETGALLAGEMSGHIFFRDEWYGFDDATYTAARLLQILARQPRSPSTVFSELPNAVSTPELRADVPEGQQFALMDRALERIERGIDETFRGAKITTIDGVRVDFDDRWGLVRASNTTPCLVFRFEARNAEDLARVQQEFKAFLQSLEASLQLPF
jgi:phosphomannomutase/phosphoglucomutase